MKTITLEAELIGRPRDGLATVRFARTYTTLVPVGAIRDLPAQAPLDAEAVIRLLRRLRNPPGTVEEAKERLIRLTQSEPRVNDWYQLADAGDLEYVYRAFDGRRRPQAKPDPEAAAGPPAP